MGRLVQRKRLKDKNKMVKVDVLCDVQFGDCGKGKVSKSLIARNKYDAVAKYNGGSNAGHAVWVGDKKYTAHQLTSGIYYSDCDIVIGPGCVVNVEKFLKEFNDFDKEFDLAGRVFICDNVHIVTEDHIEQETKESKIGTTRQGIGPAYSDKYRRTGLRAKDVPELAPFLLSRWMGDIESYDNVLMEGSQGFWLDIDHGAYPYVTSSHIHPAHAFTTFGLPIQSLGKVYGVGKVYETYVGTSDDIVKATLDDEELIRKAGSEYGETTGRPRKVGYLDLSKLITACNMIGVDSLVLNKMDILEELNIYKLWFEGLLYEFNYASEFETFVRSHIEENTDVEEIFFSGNKEKVIEYEDYE